MPFSESLRPTAEKTSIAGTLADGNKQALSTLLGQHTYGQALGSLDPDMRDHLVHATAMSWVTIYDMEHMIMACADEAERDVFALNQEMTRFGTEQSFRTVWRMLLRFATDKLILSRAAATYSRAYDRGRLEARVDSERRAQCQIHERPGMSRMTREAFGIGVETVLRLGGRGTAHVAGKATPDGAVYTILRKS